MEKDKKKLYENEQGFIIETVDMIAPYQDKTVPTTSEECQAYMLEVMDVEDDPTNSKKQVQFEIRPISTTPAPVKP